VRTIDAGLLPAGDRDLTWDGRDADGRATAAGLYWLRVRAGGAPGEAGSGAAGTGEAFRRVVRLE
jgi:flagellar hook assembly protein FlgD